MRIPLAFNKSCVIMIIYHQNVDTVMDCKTETKMNAKLNKTILTE